MAVWRRKAGWGLLVSTALFIGGCTPTQALDTPQSPPVSSPLGAYLAGNLAARSGDLSSAAPLLRQALADDPGNQDLLYRTFLATLGQGDYAAAKELAHQVLAGNLDNPLANLFLAFGEIADRKYEEADRRLQPLPRTGINNLLVPLARAWLVAARGDLKEAEARLKPLADFSQLSELYDFHRGLMAVLVKDTAYAEAAFSKLMADNPNPPLRVAELIGRFYEAQGQPDKARAIYESILSRDNNNPVIQPAMSRLTMKIPVTEVLSGPAQGMAQVMFDLSSLLQREQSSGDLSLIFGRLMMYLDPKFDLGKVLLAEVLENQKQTDAAVALYKEISRESPLSWDARQRVAIARDISGDTDGAVAELKAMGADYPDREESLARAADILRLRERFAEAVPLYDAAIARVPRPQQQHWSLFFNRAIALERSGQVEKAIEELKRTLTLEPDQPYVLNYLGYTWVDRGENIAEAKKMLQRAAELRPRDGAIIDSLGWAAYRLKDYANAVQLLERAAVLKPGDPTVNDHLGDAYWMVGRRLEARYQWERALKLNPEPQMLEPLKQKLEKGLPTP